MMASDPYATEALALALWTRDGHDPAEFDHRAATYRLFATSLMEGADRAGYVVVPRDIPDDDDPALIDGLEGGK